MKRPGSSDLTFTEQLATLDRHGKKAMRAPREFKCASPVEGREHASRLEADAETIPAPMDLDEFLTVADVARILRFTDRHVRALIDEGEIVRHQFGSAVRISRTDFQAYSARCRRSK